MLACKGLCECERFRSCTFERVHKWKFRTAVLAEIGGKRGHGLSGLETIQMGNLRKDGCGGRLTDSRNRRQQIATSLEVRMVVEVLANLPLDLRDSRRFTMLNGALEHGLLNDYCHRLGRSMP